MLAQQRSLIAILRSNVFASMPALVIALSAAALLLSSVSIAHAQTFQVLHNFTGGDDGANPRRGWSSIEPEICMEHRGKARPTTAASYLR